MKQIYLLLCLISINMVKGQNPVVLKNAEFETGTFKNLEFLKNELSNVKLLGLGESSHYMGGTYVAKIKMVKYLHEQCGYDILAFEMPMYNLSNLNTALQKGELTSDYLFKNVSGVWGTLEMIELYDYVIATQKTERPLKIAGFDDNFFGSSKLDNLPSDYYKFVDDLKANSGQKIELDTLFFKAINRVAENSYYFKKISPSDTLLMNKKFGEINQALQNVNYSSNIYFQYWKQLTDNLQSVYRKNYKLSNRDQQMYKNVKFLNDVAYKNDKIILWGASIHLMYNFKEVDDKRYKNNDNYMGSYLKREYGEKYYCLAFTALQGKIGFKGYLGLGKFKIRTSKNSIERYIATNTDDANYAYISMRSDNLKQLFHEKNVFKSNILGVQELEMNLTEVVDGIFYLRDERLVTFKQ